MNTEGRGETAATILVIDDNSCIRDLLARLLRRYGRVECAATVDEGLQIFSRCEPGLVITDYEMPGRNGIDGIRAMKALAPGVHIVMLTGSATRELIDEAKREGACECLEKPFGLDALRELTARCLAV